MALDAYTQGLTAQEIAEQCEALTANPGLHLYQPTQLAPANAAEFKATPAYRQLRTIVTELYLQYEWPFLATGAGFFITGRESPLPQDFWRIQFPDPLILLVGDQRKVLWHFTPEQWFSRALTTGSGVPRSFTIDKSRSTLYVEPAPDQNYMAELHYYRRPNLDNDAAPDKLTAITDVVRFPHSDLLIQKLLAFYYQQQDDTRWIQAKQEAVDQLARIRASSDDDRDSAGSIPLDSQVFSSPYCDGDWEGW